MSVKGPSFPDVAGKHIDLGGKHSSSLELMPDAVPTHRPAGTGEFGCICARTAGNGLSIEPLQPRLHEESTAQKMSMVMVSPSRRLV
ncbi:MAG TPA: hypothetical protein PKM95_12575, partial [Deltaproteobacteria bacterium]|nr:hypothetical protein [Deltaproteobacteria bacterium]